MRRSRKRVEKDSSERWLLTYADLITLLMIFFVIMFAMSQINETKFLSLQKSLQAALAHSNHIPINQGSSSFLEAAGTSGARNGTPSNFHPTSNAQLDHLYQQVQNFIVQHHLQNNVQITNEQRGVQITLRDVVLFDTGKADIRPQAQGILGGLVPFLQQLNNPIVVEGFTDNQPISTPQFPTNWELSSARAIGVVRFLISQGVVASRLAGVGYGQYHALAKNDTAEHRQENRRVNIVILRDQGTPLAAISVP